MVKAKITYTPPIDKLLPSSSVHLIFLPTTRTWVDNARCCDQHHCQHRLHHRTHHHPILGHLSKQPSRGTQRRCYTKVMPSDASLIVIQPTKRSMNNNRSHSVGFNWTAAGDKAVTTTYLDRSISISSSLTRRLCACVCQAFLATKQQNWYKSPFKDKIHTNTWVTSYRLIIHCHSQKWKWARKYWRKWVSSGGNIPFIYSFCSVSCWIGSLTSSISIGTCLQSERHDDEKTNFMIMVMW